MHRGVKSSPSESDWYLPRGWNEPPAVPKLMLGGIVRMGDITWEVVLELTACNVNEAKSIAGVGESMSRGREA